jgi:hypothetical protein
MGFWNKTDCWCSFSWCTCEKTAILLSVSRETVSKVMSAHTNHGKTTSAKRNSEPKLAMTERDRRRLRRIVSKNHRTTAPQVTGQQIWIFMLKTMFPQKLPDVSFTNPTSTVGLQLLNLWLLIVMLRCVNDDVTTIKPGYETLGNAHVILSDEPTLKNTQRSIQSGLSGTQSETCGRFCDCLDSKIIVQYSVGPIITLHGLITARDYVDRLGNRCITLSRRYFRTTIQVSKMTMPRFTQLVLFSYDLKSMKVSFNIFPGQHGHQIWTLLNHSG